MYEDNAIPIDNSTSYTMNSVKMLFDICTKSVDINTYLP